MGAAAAVGCATGAERSPRLDRIDALFVDVSATGPGYALGVSRDGELIHAAGYGTANLEHGVAIDARTNFHVASLAKQFTGAAVALSVLDGNLSLDARAADYFPTLRGFADGVTIAHLVYMTSGLPDYFTLPRASDLPWFSAYRFTVQEAITTVLAARRLDYQPGARWSYSNIDYMLLAEIVAKVQGKPFAAFVAERIFAPLGMSASCIDDNAMTPIARSASGYAPRTEEVVRQLASVGIEASGDGPWLKMQRMSPHYGGGGVFTSVADWARWDANWSTRALGGEAFYELMHTRRRFAHDKDNDALGLVFGDYQGAPMIWYEGGDIDASSFMARLPESNLSVWCFSNNPLGGARDRVMRVLGALR